MEKTSDIIFVVIVYIAITVLFILLASLSKAQNKAFRELWKYLRSIEDHLNTTNYKQAHHVLKFLEGKQDLTDEDKFVIEKCKKLIADYESIYKTPQG